MDYDVLAHLRAAYLESRHGRPINMFKYPEAAQQDQSSKEVGDILGPGEACCSLIPPWPTNTYIITARITLTQRIERSMLA